ncbi:ribonuclease H-like domain-containing protein, partial [Tanacetum coccineum]
DKPPKNKGVSSSSEEDNIDQCDPLFLHSNDTNAVPIIDFKLEGTKNYKVWKATITIVIHTKNKLGFINGKIERPEEAGFMQEQLDMCNSVVLNWILGCVSQDVFMGQVFCKIAKVVWDKLEEIYSKQDASVIFNVHYKIHSLSQSGLTLSEYYDKFNALWRQYDSLVDLLDCICENFEKLKKHNQLIKLMQFLICLVKVYAPIRSIILTTNPIPDVKGAFATLCFELVGYPPNFKKRNGSNQGGSSNATTLGTKDQSFVSSNTFTDEQFKRLMDLISEKFGFNSIPTNVAGYQALSEKLGFISSECKEYEMVYQKTGNLNFFDLEDNYNSDDPYDDGRDKESDIGEGINLPQSEGTEKTNDTRRDEGEHPDDSTSVEATGGVEENTTYEKNDKESEGDDSFYQEFNENFQPTNDIPNRQDNVNLRRSSRKAGMPAKLSDFHIDTKVKYNIDKHVNYSKLSHENYSFSTSINKIYELNTYNKALSDNRWVEAMNLEMEALNRNNTWVITDLPTGRKVIGGKWVFKVKYKSTGDVERFKARCILSLSVQYDWPIFQLDINNAFLYGDLVEDVYMSLPDGYLDKDDKRVCKLVKSFKNDFSLFTKTKQEMFIALLVYVDDIVITGNDLNEIDKVKEFLRSKFMIKDLGKLKYFLGIEVHKGENGLVLTQRNLVSWKSKKQSVLAKSSAEAEYRAMNIVTCEVIWIMKIMNELNVKVALPVTVNCDNSSIIHHERTKHFEIELFFLREKVVARIIKTVKVKSEENMADIFTKGLSVVDHNKFCNMLKLKDLYHN